MLALAMLVWFASFFGARPAQAAGCHVTDRPVLGVNPPLQDARHVAAWVMPDDGELAPPVLARVPCPGETPQASGSTMATIGFACLAAVVSGPVMPSGSFQAADDIESPDPHPFRLDRPPR
jgi:hypothetical protein